jgi:hypothetical protein
MLTSAAKQRRVPENKDEGQPESSPTNPEAQWSGWSPLSLSVTDNVINSRAGKRQRSIKDGDLSNHDAKRPKRLRHSKEDFIENWLSESCRSRRSLTDNETLLREVSDNMPRKPTEVLPSPGDSFNSIVSSSRKSERSAASVHDTNYRDFLRYRNIYIERENPPVELMHRAKRIISRPRASPEMDDAAIQKLRDKSRRLQNEAEEEIVQQLGPHIIPAMDEIPDQRLVRNVNQLWSNSVPVPLNPNVLTNPLPLPRPKPDLAFGYSEAAFTEKQLMTIDLLIDQSGRSYAVPDQKLRFPFLDSEFKSQAKNGTQYVATNQVTGAGAVALNGNMELIQRSFGAGSFDFDEPQFFSVTMDHEYARINVHWLSWGVQDGPFSFHMEGLSKHFLDDPIGIRALVRAVKNVLNYGSDERLRKLCEALDAYRETVILKRKAVTTQRNQGYEVQTEPQPEQRRSRRVQLPSYEQQEYQSRPDLRVEERAYVYAEEDWFDGSLDGSPNNLQAERRPRRKQTTARRPEERSRANISAKTVRISSRRARVVEYD